MKLMWENVASPGREELPALVSAASAQGDRQMPAPLNLGAWTSRPQWVPSPGQSQGREERDQGLVLTVRGGLVLPTLGRKHEERAINTATSPEWYFHFLAQPLFPACLLRSSPCPHPSSLACCPMSPPPTWVTPAGPCSGPLGLL